MVCARANATVRELRASRPSLGETEQDIEMERRVDSQGLR